MDEQPMNKSDEQVLSQRLTQLSCSQPSQQQNINQSGKLPWYLSNKNESYEKLINELYFTITTTINNTITSSASVRYEQELRQMAILIYRIKSEQIFQSLWITYLKSGTGQLHINQRGPSVWPTQVQTIVKQANNAADNQNDACMKLVQERLDEFKTKIQQYEIQINNLKHRLQGNKEAIFRTIETFIQQNQENFRQKMEHKIKLVQYDYNDRALELEFLRQNPSEYCIKLYKHLYDARYKQDVTREEVQLVNERITYYNKNSSKLHQQVSHPTFISTIINQDAQQRLYDQLTAAVEQAKVDMLNLYVKTADIQMKNYDKQYNKELNKMFIERNQKSLPIEQQLTSIMLNLLEKRADNKKERIKCITISFHRSILFQNMNLNDTNITSDIQLVQELQPILKKKCHGNRSDQRFRQSCRKKNMDETTITQLIEQRRNDRKRNQTDQAANNTDINKQNMHTKISDISMGHEQSLDKNGNQSRIITTTIEKPNKRKRDALPKEKTYNVAKSSSQLSFFQTSIKKKKKNNKKQKKNNNNKKQKSRIWRSKIKKTIKNRNHRQSAYLKVSWNTLMNNLKIHLKSPLKKRNEQKFVYARLYLFDEEFTLDLDQYLWKSYLDLGSQQQQQQQPEVWPSEVYRMAKTNEPDLCKQYIVEYLNEIKIHLDLCRIKLNTQAQSWISTLPSLEILDDNLKQYVRLQNKHLSTTIDKQLARYKNVLEEKKVLQQISFYLTPNDQVLMDELINLQQIQIQLLEEFNMLEQRIICIHLWFMIQHLLNSKFKVIELYNK
ncbi:unnamed protein product [Rotaria socialis]|uniref:Uncharacterized protein n=2 Tax=Rotaria socialis TaxID=392032 RepID=A0A820YIW6_9BILA|nr:unnamed protein product [Rotaria socialis]